MSKKSTQQSNDFENKHMQDIGKAFEKSTSMKVVPTPPAQQGQTTFAKNDSQYNQKQ